MDSGDYETEEDSAPETCVSPGGGLMLPSNSREMRNKAEKQRRDRLNAFIGELATLVPMVARSAKRMDKTSILRLTATHLRIYQTLVNGKGIPHMQLPKHVDQYVLEQLVCEQLGGFLLILTPTGKVVFISHTIENLLGHLQTDLMGQSLFNITAPDDHERLRMYLQCEGVVEQEWRKYFNIRLKRAGPRSESAVYEPVRMMGMHRRLSGDNNQNSQSSSSSTSNASNTFNSEVLVFFVKICRPEPLVTRLIEASKDEYVTRHLIDGRIINCDQRISIIAGYMIEEVSGHSAFKYMHRDDVRWVMIALRQMYDRGESRGTSCYRLQSRNGQFIYLRTFGFLEIDDQGTVESFVCVNTLVEDKEGLHLIDEMKKRYSALISATLPFGNQGASSLTPPRSNDSIDLVEDPQQVEQAVAHLMCNLPSPGSDHRSTPSPLVHYENQDCTSLTNIVTEHSNKPYQVRIKTVAKRPPSTDIQVDANLNNKRQKTTPQVSPVHRTISPYPKRPPVLTDGKVKVTTRSVNIPARPTAQSQRMKNEKKCVIFKD
ncbi:aryl hydrocarbon receptor nuclear translocator-like protein 1 isoform X3 [Anoplophora glabripennis]|uniref:aryl hydrocarbon receptor nuclear translocator-like protein 1 isoform X3 n=1 Tax=Anoplophora glabripennis TaxID=217634 RepID=UPI000873BF0D|nr:aryl hydrocarbon receptor nuclear translocator-like protein 1 isoform X3 [Anoplophora glabripennis]XP_018570170.1 aryl hydrocarbon receptor nuclear translocator-like protein 1 isoform X3 [Anoplophora glabripennis]